MRKYIGLISLFIAIGSFFVVHPVSAHVLQTDGTIGAVFHVEPDDSAISGSPTAYGLQFKDTENKLSLYDCKCSVIVRLGAKQISKSVLKTQSSINSSDSYTFPNPGDYTMEFVGVPKTAGEFSSFHLSYEVRVLAPSGRASMQQIPISLWIGIGLVIALLLLGSYKIL